ncbi:hypothetical protein H9W91_07395 [Streptomyces alfalfae]|uniref:hypothetical protein n=1 Tax=Streptomyces alfalfae TaxID=1642299 RepID=UPI001BA94B73|nr:hypothetical protein [Streptomyces alfalfae]QUI30703.1 hypothetical protein H9W91_07395 [Streptomyces alfalfae]
MLRDLYRITFTGEDDDQEYPYELDVYPGTRPRVVAFTAHAFHHGHGLPEVDFISPRIEFLGQIEDEENGK